MEKIEIWSLLIKHMENYNSAIFVIALILMLVKVAIFKGKLMK